MKISIITVCFNSADTLENTIVSVIEQTHSNIEYIIIDGGSNDSTLEIIEKYKDHISVYVSEPDRGIYDAMNKGVALCTGDVVGILNSDDVFATSAELQHVENEFERSPSICCLLGNIEFRNFESGRLLRRYTSKKFKPYKLRFGWMPPHPATFVRRAVYTDHGPYHLNFKIAADYERFVNWLIVHKLPYSKSDRTVVHMRVGGVSTSGLWSLYTANTEIIRACKVNGVYTNLLFLTFKLPFKLLELVSR